MKRTLERETVFTHFLTQLSHFSHIKEVKMSGHGLAFSCLLNGKSVRAVALVKSSDYWEYRLHLQRPSTTLVVCYRHDSVVPTHVLALEDGRDYEPEDLPGKYASIADVAASLSRHNARIFFGALMCGKKAAHDLLQDMKESTRRKYEAKMHKYQRRQRGRPLAS